MFYNICHNCPIRSKCRVYKQSSSFQKLMVHTRNNMLEDSHTIVLQVEYGLLNVLKGKNV